VQRGTFFFPGPTEVRTEILEAMLRQPLPHRSPEFRERFAALQDGLGRVFRTTRPVYIATASGTAMMEAAVRCAPAGRILALVNGAFAERFVRIAQACARSVDRMEVAFGDVPDPDAVAAALERGSYSAVTVVHSETSTGALADVAAIARVARDAGAATIVDSVSGVGGAQLEVDAWGVDCAVSASQKALALPPGLAFAVASEQFLGAADAGTDRGVYLDLLEFDRHARNNETPATPAVSLMYALERQLAAIQCEGIEARWMRHEAMRAVTEKWVDRTREVRALDIRMLARPGARSPTVSVVTVPAGISAPVLVDRVASRGYTIGAGYGPLRETTFRVGHMGDHRVDDLEQCLAAISDALQELAPRVGV
jgi:aspartate aminotransferase-like enzyme